VNYLSVCSGIEAATVAWKPLGWNAVAFSEIERFPNMVLNHHYPDVPNLGDMNDFRQWPEAEFDVLVGGTPCQSFSVAGLRQGLADPRGNLALVYLAVAERYRPVWLVWENVPGVLSADEGRAFGAFIGAMVELGYGAAWRVLDAQYFGVPQRRRRVFVVGYLGDWRRATEVLFESASLRRNPPPSREAREGIANAITERPDRGGGNSEGQRLIPIAPTIYCPEVSPAMKARDHKGPSSDGDGDGDGLPLIAHSLRADGFDASEDGTGRGTPLVAFAQTQRDEVRIMDKAGALAAEPGAKQQTYVAYETGPGFWQHGQQTGTLRAEGENRPSRPSNVVQTGMAVRRLTPLECERLQGFPDGYTGIPGASDSGRYKALGNSMAVPVMRWIGERVTDQIGKEKCA
jgi:DNA (cytosine-5)-methyltransferase 1